MDSIVVDEYEETPEEAEQYASIEEAPEVEQPQAEPEVELPAKFKGKSMEEIISSYENLEKELGRKGQEVGELRKLTDSILQQQVAKNDNGTETLEEDVDFFDDPNLAVSKAIENHPKFRKFEEQQKMQQIEATTRKIKEAHPDFMDIVQDTKFQEWVKNSPVRQNLFAAAHNRYDYNAAMELFNNWKERSLISNTQEAEAAKSATRNEALKAGKGVSRTSSESTTGKKIYRRADLIRLRTNDPSRYEALQDEILAAYAEGRVK